MLNKVLKYYLTFLIILFWGIGSTMGQLYVGKACVADQTGGNIPGGPGTNPGNMDQSCDEPTYFFEQSESDGGTWTWDFGDGTVIPGATRNIYYSYQTPGNYTVTVTNPNGETFSESKTVGYYPPKPSFKDDKDQDQNQDPNQNQNEAAEITICGGSKTTLDPYKVLGPISNRPSNVEYKWFPNGETTPTIEVDEPGCYSVEVIDITTGCSRSATVNVKVCFEDAATDGGSEEWYFGLGSGLNFQYSATQLEPDTTKNDGDIFEDPEFEDPAYSGSGAATNAIQADEAAALVMNSSGKVMFYTDGKKIYSGEDDSPINFSDGSDFNLNINPGIQGLALVPKPVCGSCNFVNYYLFTADENTSLLSYSVIDIRENDGLGAVTETNIPLAVNIKGNLAVERSEDDESYVITFYDGKRDELLHLIVDELGVFTQPLPNGPLDNNIESEGYISVSENGTLLAHGVVENGKNVIRLYERDSEMGILTPLRTIDLGVDAPPRVYGLAFSPNGGRIYVSLNGDGLEESVLLQINLEDADKIEEIYKTTRKEEFGALAMGPKYGEGRKFLYLTIKDQTVIHYIQLPDGIGKDEVGFTMNSGQGIDVRGITKLGFPNVAAPVQDDSGEGLSAQFSGTCINSPTTFIAEDICSPYINEMTWVIEGKRYKGNQIKHEFSEPGWHDVILQIDVYRPLPNPIGGLAGQLADNYLKEYCTTVVDTGRVYIRPAPELEYGYPFYVCTKNQAYFRYEPQPTGGEGFEYDWMTMAGASIGAPDNTLPYFDFMLATPIQVDITNSQGCASNFKFNVEPGCEPVVVVPDVFTPNSDGENDILDIKYNFIDNYIFEIYDRWGEVVFRTDDLEVKWDGRIKGRTAHPNQLFAYMIRYIAVDMPDQPEGRQIGSILILK